MQPSRTCPLSFRTSPQDLRDLSQATVVNFKGAWIAQNTLPKIKKIKITNISQQELKLAKMVILRKLQTRNLIITAKRKPELNHPNILYKTNQNNIK